MQVLLQLCEASFLVSVEPRRVLFAYTLQLEQRLVLELLLGEGVLDKALLHSEEDCPRKKTTHTSAPVFSHFHQLCLKQHHCDKGAIGNPDEFPEAATCQAASLRDCDDELSHISSLVELEVKCLVFVRHQTDVLPLVLIPRHGFILLAVEAETRAFSANQEARQRIQVHALGYP